MFFKKATPPAKMVIAIVAALVIVGGGVMVFLAIRNPDLCPPVPWQPVSLAPGVAPFSLPENERQCMIAFYGLTPTRCCCPCHSICRLTQSKFYRHLLQSPAMASVPRLNNPSIGMNSWNLQASILVFRAFKRPFSIYSSAVVCA